MPLARPNQYAAMLDAAADGGFAYPAVNVTSSQTLNAALDGFAAAGSDGIVQVTVGGAGYLSGGGKAHAVAGARALALMAGELAARVPVLVALHTDHCPPAQEESFLRPLIDASRERGAPGEPPLFCSHMFDGSTLALDENLRRAAELLALCRDAGIVLEVEVGVVGGEEDGIGGDGVSGRYTTADDLLRVARALGTGERGRYLLAATFGNVHGLTAPGTVELRPEILRDGQAALARERPGARFDYVFHGSSGSAPDDLAAAVSYGVVKVNLDSEAQYAFTRGAAGHMFAEYDGVLMIDGRRRAQGRLRPAVMGSQGPGRDGGARRRRLPAARLRRSQPEHRCAGAISGAASPADATFRCIEDWRDGTTARLLRDGEVVRRPLDDDLIFIRGQAVKARLYRKFTPVEGAS